MADKRGYRSAISPLRAGIGALIAAAGVASTPALAVQAEVERAYIAANGRGGPLIDRADVETGYYSESIVVRVTPQALNRVHKSAAAGGKAQLGDAKIDAVLAKHGAVSVTPAFNHLGVNPALESKHRLDRYFQVTLPKGTNTPALAAELNAVKGGTIEIAEFGTIGGTASEPNDPFFSTLWGLNNTGQSTCAGVGTAGAHIQAVDAWGVWTGTDNIVVAVIDSGVSSHPDLEESMLWDLAYNSFTEQYGKNAVIDLCPHGTHVAGTVAARGDNGVGVVGVSWGALVLPIDVLGAGCECCGTELDCSQGIVYAANNGANVLTMSLRYWSGPDYFNDAIQYAWESGCLIDAAAGNDFPTPPQWPASFENVLAVGATTNKDQIAGFSSQGAVVRISAPGVDVNSIWTGNGYTCLSGTSMAAPHVAGAAALIWSSAPSMTNQAVVDALIEGAEDKGAPGWDPAFGFGRLNVFNSILLADPGLSVQVTQNAPKLIPPGESPLLKVKIQEGNETLVKGSETLYYSYDGGAFKSMPLVHLGGELYEVNLPAVSCGDSPSWYLSAESVESGAKTAPHNAPDKTYTSSVGVIEVQTVAYYGLNAGLPEGWAASGMWHVTDKCAKGPSCDGGTFLYYGQDAKCNFDNGQTNSGTVTTTKITLPKIDPAATLALKFCAIRQDEGGTPYDDATIKVNGKSVGQPNQSADWTQNSFDLSPFAGETVTIEFTYNTIDSIANNMLGLMIDGITIEASMVVCEDTCYADFDGNGQLNLFDFLAYTNAFNAGDKAADCTGDGALNLFDFLCYNNAFNAGC